MYQARKADCGVGKKPPIIGTAWDVIEGLPIVDCWDFGGRWFDICEFFVSGYDIVDEGVGSGDFNSGAIVIGEA